MALINPASMPVIRGQVDLFSSNPTDTTVESSFYAEYKPAVNIQDSDSKIEFKISGNSVQYLDLNDSFLYLKLKVVAEDGTDLVKGDDVSCVNNLLHTLFSNCDVYISNKLIETSNNCYGYKAYIESLLSYGTDYIKSQGKCALFVKDTNGCVSNDTNDGYKKRQGFIVPTKIFELCDKLKIDVKNADRYILNNTNVQISLTRARDCFTLLYNQAASSSVPPPAPKNPVVRILDASFFVRKQVLFPSIAISHQKLLDAGNKAKYMYKGTNVKFFTIPAGNQSFTEENIFYGTLPTRIIIGLVNGAAFSGNYELNPFKFQPFGLNFISLTVNNIPLPIKALNVDFDKDQCLLPYYLLFPNIGISSQDAGIIVSRDEYKNGNCLLAFDLSQSDQWGAMVLEKTGTVRVELQFSKALANSVNCVVYSENQKILELDNFREPNII